MEKANPVISSSWAVGVRIDTAHAGEVSFGISQPEDMLGMVAFSEWRTQVASIAKGTEQRLGFRFKLRL